MCSRVELMHSIMLSSISESTSCRPSIRLLHIVIISLRHDIASSHAFSTSSFNCVGFNIAAKLFIVLFIVLLFSKFMTCDSAHFCTKLLKTWFCFEIFDCKIVFFFAFNSPDKTCCFTFWISCFYYTTFISSFP